MSKIFSLTTILTTLIGTGIVGSLVALPVRANEANSIKSTANAELILGQISDGNRSQNTEPSDSLKNIVGLTGLAVGTGVVVSKTSATSASCTL